MVCNLVTLLLNVTESFGVRLIESLVWAYVLHAECLVHGGQTFELDDGAVGAHLFYLFTVFDVDIRRIVLLVMLDGETIAWRRTLAAKALHLWADDIDAQRAKSRVVGDDFTMACDDDFGQ